MRLVKLLSIVPALALALAGCKEEGVEGPFQGCLPVSYASLCSSDAQCCSFGCIYGQCVANPVEGGICRSNGDCESPRVCMNGQCTTVPGGCISGGTCAPGGTPCCWGSCTGGTCAVDAPPTAVPGRTPATSPVPWHLPIQLTNASTDPNTGNVGLAYRWTVVSAPAGSTATFVPSATYATPTFTPDKVGTYQLSLQATNTLSHTATLTFTTENTAPVATVDPHMAATTRSRNVPLQFSVPVSDADGGPVTCAWSKIPPGATDPVVVTSATPCAAQTGGAANGGTTVGFDEDLEGIWTLRLVTSDGEPANDRTWNRFITVVNDRPTIDAMPERVGNFGAPGEAAPGIPLHAVARDVNRDVELGNVTYSWRLTSTKPAGEPRAAGTEIGTGSDPVFVPSAVGAYRIDLEIDDHHTSGVATASVDVLVEPYVLPLGVVADAVHDKGSNKVVAVGTAAGGSHRLWVIDPAAPRILHDVTLAARPTCVSLSFDGADALVGESGGWQLVTALQTTPIAGPQRGFYHSGVVASAEAAGIVHLTAPNAERRGFATDTGGRAYELFLAATGAPFSDWASCPSCNTTTEPPRGTRLAASPTTLWLLDPTDGRLARYAVSQSNFNLSFGAAATHGGAGGLSGTGGLWLGAGGSDLFTTTRTVYASDTLAARASQLTSARDHLDSTLASGLKGVSATWTSTALLRFDSGFTSDTGALQLPKLGRSGTGYPTYGRFAFVRADESAFYAIVRANTGAGTPVYEWGLVNLGP
jgi:hypothetical protein